MDNDDILGFIGLGLILVCPTTLVWACFQVSTLAGIIILSVLGLSLGVAILRKVS